jgi:hypothetical protein
VPHHHPGARGGAGKSAGRGASPWLVPGAACLYHASVILPILPHAADRDPEPHPHPQGRPERGLTLDWALKDRVRQLIEQENIRF